MLLCWGIVAAYAQKDLERLHKFTITEFYEDQQATTATSEEYKDVDVELIHAVSDSDLTEFNLQDDTLNISMSKEKTIVQQMAVNTDPADAQQYQPVVQQAVHVESVNAVNDEVQTGSVVKSPLVGTYYAASSPENPPFVKVGDKVSKGQVLGIVEAMKLMNEIESEFDGTVKEILVENEQMVEFGQPMFVIE